MIAEFRHYQNFKELYENFEPDVPMYVDLGGNKSLWEEGWDYEYGTAYFERLFLEQLGKQGIAVVRDFDCGFWAANVEPQLIAMAEAEGRI